MKNAPVYYALTQARFNTIAAMSKYVSEIQDRFRRRGYILFEAHQVTQLQLSNAPQRDEPQVTSTTSWLITKENRSAGFILTTSSLAFHTTHYDTHEEFLPELLQGLQIVHEVVNLDQISRLGIRYLDAVLPLKNEHVKKYLVDGLHGIDFHAKQDYSLNESIFQTDSGPLLTRGKLISRVIQLTSILGYPPDILPHGLVQKESFEVKEACPHAIIDTDHFVEGSMPLDFEKINEQLLSLHAVIKQIFEATTTEHAKSVWR